MFFKSIKKSSIELWGEEQRKAFAELKEYMSSPPILVSPKAGEDLYMYLAVSKVPVSAALFKEADGKQKPVFYTSRMLADPETWYSVTEKLVLALVNAKKKLKPYFEAHTIVVLTEHSL